MGLTEKQVRQKLYGEYFNFLYEMYDKHLYKGEIYYIKPGYYENMGSGR